MELALEQLATHIPDIVLQRPGENLPQTVHLYGVIVFADISGYTNLCEKYASFARSKVDAADHLTTILNTYLSKIVQVILEAGGDVLKFAGDALLALWSCSRFSIHAMLEHVLHICLDMQKEFDKFKTQDGEILRMKIGLSIGKVDLHYVGNNSVRLFDVTGEAIVDSNTAQQNSTSGTVVISKLAWEFLDSEKCIAKIVGPGYSQVSELRDEIIERDSRSTLTGTGIRKRTILSITGSDALEVSMSLNSGELLSTHSKPKVAESPKKAAESPKKAAKAKVITSQQRGLYFRCKTQDVLPLLSEDTQHDLRTYIIPTVLHKIDHGHDVNWFSELREVSVVFINLIPGCYLDARGTLTLLQNSFDIIYPPLTHYNAILNKVFMFDKGCTFLCIFGLPHTRHEDSTCSALRAARDIFNALHSLEIDCQYSIGVTTGIAFCGVVGHPQRHEYTVIGQKVNMAARLMVKFGGCITCDEVTKTKSSLSADQFKLIQNVTLKGIVNPENIYEFSPEHVETMKYYNWDVHMATDADDLIGRSEEMQVFLDELMHVSEHTNRDTGVIIINGTGGIGKTKLLRAMKARAAMMNFRVVSGIGGLIEQNTPFFTVKTLVAKLLQIDSCKNIHEREQLLLEHITDPEMRELLPLLNDLLVLKFPRTSITAEMVQYEARTKALHKLLFSIVHQEALMKPCVFGIDDAHWIDPDSWLFLLDLMREPNAIVILTTRPLERITKKPPGLIEILNHPLTKVITLQGLGSREVVELVCQQLGVETIPDELKEIIMKRSHGVPLWCEELVETMLELDYLQVVGDDPRSPSTSLESNKRRAVVKFRGRRSNTTLQSEDIPIPDSVNGMVLARIDHMSASEQMTLKCAAIAGNTFTRGMLQAIIPNCNPTAFHNSLNELAEAGIIECAVAAKVRSMKCEENDKDLIQHSESSLYCTCLENTVNKPTDLLHKHHTTYPLVEQCDSLQFVHNYIQETAYNLWTETQRKILHEAAAHFLESQAHKCKNCGGGDFLTGKDDSLMKRKRNISKRVYVGSGGSRLQRRRSSPANKQDAGRKRQKYRKASRTSSGTGGSTRSSMEQEDEKRKQSCMLNINMEECHCDLVLAYVYPQLVRHWRAAGDLHNTMTYLIEEASAAVATYNNMESLSLLQEASEIIEDDDTPVSNQEKGRLQSLVGQTLYQMGQVEESMKHFHEALKLLELRLPRTIVGGSFSLAYHSIKQFVNSKFGSNRPLRYRRNEPFLDRARCLAHISHAYRLQSRNVMGFMTVLKRVDAAEQAQDYHPHEVMEAYAAMIEHCLQVNFIKLANHYFTKAMAYCEDMDFNMEDIHAYAHLLFVGLSLKLYQGDLQEALSIGTASYNAIKKKHDASMEFSTLPLLFFANMACFNRQAANEILKEFSEVAKEANDLRVQALYDCCHFDALLEFGVDWQAENMIVTKAEACCSNREVYYYDEVERYYLVSCLALWHARKGNYSYAKRYSATAKELQPRTFLAFLAIKAHSRYTEVFLLLLQHDFSKEKDLAVNKALKTFRATAQKFQVFEPRYQHFCAYYNMILGRFHRAEHFLNRAFIEANRCGCLYDAKWCIRSRNSWFPQTTFKNQDLVDEKEVNEDIEDTVFMFEFSIRN